MAGKKSKSQKKTASSQKKAASPEKPKMSKEKIQKVAGAAAILAALGLGAYGASKTEKGKAAIQKAKSMLPKKQKDPRKEFLYKAPPGTGLFGFGEQSDKQKEFIGKAFYRSTG